jgi:hypothetical protein
MSKVATSYNPLEVAYAEPFADALAGNPSFCSWVLGKTDFAGISDGSHLLHDEMRKKRSKKARTWWGSHYRHTCDCIGCRGQETDLLAVFESIDAVRFALHFEVKRPGDTFGENQAAAYPVRATCWLTNKPAAVVPHALAATVLLCSKSQLSSFSRHLRHFDAVITFEEIESRFPGWRSNYE